MLIFDFFKIHLKKFRIKIQKGEHHILPFVFYKFDLQRQAEPVEA